EKFLNNYDLAVQNWIDKHPGWERLIADSPVSSEEIRKRLTFAWQFYKVVPPDQSPASESLQAEVANLGSTLFGEIAKEAQSIWNRRYSSRTEVSHKALSPLKSLRQKLTGLSFVEPKVAPIADLIEETLNGIPKRGLINGSPLLLLQGLVSVLKDPDLLVEHGQKILSGQSPSSLLQDIQDTKFDLDLVGIDGQDGPDLELEVLDELGLGDDQDQGAVISIDDDFDFIDQPDNPPDSPLPPDSDEDFLTNDGSDNQDDSGWMSRDLVRSN
ncbi:MAG: DUF3150 domain-containing protein, partial [Deltaproteobacteria bacterium]|nr:DUF3150 domain-containing protein [Deltaproteobacteria bacterium]